jgi:hypothetical protein
MLTDKPHRPVNVGFVRELSVAYYLPASFRKYRYTTATPGGS